MCYGRLDEFRAVASLRGLDAVSAFNSPLVAVRRISTGNALPPWRRTTVHELYERVGKAVWCARGEQDRVVRLGRSGRHQHLQLDAGRRQRAVPERLAVYDVTSTAARCRSTR
jgi:hypothetical protein